MIKWWWGTDSNRRTRRERIYSPPRLATSLPHLLVPEAGLEPATYWLQVSCSTNWAIPAVIKLWWRMTGSNRRPSACKADALPAELILHLMVTRTGFEPVYACVKGMCVKPLHQRACSVLRLFYFSIFVDFCQILFLFFYQKQLIVLNLFDHFLRRFLSYHPCRFLSNVFLTNIDEFYFRASFILTTSKSKW